MHLRLFKPWIINQKITIFVIKIETNLKHFSTQLIELFLLFTIFFVALSVKIMKPHENIKYTTKTELSEHKEINTDLFVEGNFYRSTFATAPIFPSRKLSDGNELQLMHANANGLKEPYKNNRSFEMDSAMLAEQGLLIKIIDNPLYRIKELTHSYPYVTPSMAQLLNTIGYRFQKKMEKYGPRYSNYSVMVTSALRTMQTQNTLNRYNSNAADLSAHIYGTTVDISYRDFYNSTSDVVIRDAHAIQALTEVMQDLRQECQLVVKKEYRQACFHFTVVDVDLQRIAEIKNDGSILRYNYPETFSFKNNAFILKS